MTETTSPPAAAADVLAIRDAIGQGLQLAALSLQAGRLADAESLYRGVLDLQPDHAGAHQALGGLLMRQGQPEAALPHYAAACAAAPQAGPHWLAVAECLIALQRNEEAAQVLDTAIGAGLDDPQAAALLRQARPAADSSQGSGPALIDQAIEAARGAAALLADIEALAALSVRKAAVRKPRRKDESVPAELLAPLNTQNWPALAAAARQLLAHKSLHSKAWHLLGMAYLQQDKNDAARVALKRASELMPDNPEVWDHLGIAQRQAGEYAAAERCFRRSLALAPQRPDTWMNLGNLQTDQGDYATAVRSFEHVLSLRPDSAEACSNLGRALRLAGDLPAAAGQFQRAVALKPNLAKAHVNLGNALRDLKRYEEAVQSYERARALKPGLETIYLNLATTQTQVGLIAEAVSNYERALALNPDNFDAYGMLLFHLSHSETATPEAVFAAHRAFGERMEHSLRAGWPAHPNVRDPERRLRVGFVSADLRNHAVATFLIPIWSKLDPQRTEIWAYSNHRQEDATTAHLKTLARNWCSVVDLSDQALAQRILDDRIDILIDLSGHTSGNRLPVFARKPAPLQLSWIGYPNTTGLTAMDYYLADRHLAPPGQLDALFSEKIVRLPIGAGFHPWEHAPPVAPLPALESGIFTFGSFNRIGKIGAGTIALWSRVLQAAPQARLLLGGLSDEEVHSRLEDNLIAQFAASGIARERIELQPRQNMPGYLALHRQIDLILDSFPYSGGTTTGHAAWMGVPVLTLTGRTMSSLQSAAFNGHLGLNEFVTDSPDAYVAAAAGWTRRLAELAAVRQSMRDRFANSLLSRPDMAATGVAAALRGMWRNWCAGRAAESFEVRL